MTCKLSNDLIQLTVQFNRMMHKLDYYRRKGICILYDLSCVLAVEGL